MACMVEWFSPISFSLNLFIFPSCANICKSCSHMLLETSLEAEATSYTSLYFGGLEQVSDKCFIMMRMVIVSKHWMVWSFSGLKICFCLHGCFCCFLFLGQICLEEAVESGSRGTEGDHPTFLLITSVWESYADEKSRILIGKLTHLEIREYVSSPTKPTLGLGLQFPRGNSLACILHWTAKNNDFRCKTKEFSQKAVFKVKGTIWSWNESCADSQGRAEWGGAHSEITSIWSLCLKLFPLFLLLSIFFS